MSDTADVPLHYPEPWVFEIEIQRGKPLTLGEFLEKFEGIEKDSYIGISQRELPNKLVFIVQERTQRPGRSRIERRT